MKKQQVDNLNLGGAFLCNPGQARLIGSRRSRHAAWCELEVYVESKETICITLLSVFMGMILTWYRFVLSTLGIRDTINVSLVYQDLA